MFLLLCYVIVFFVCLFVLVTNHSNHESFSLNTQLNEWWTKVKYDFFSGTVFFFFSDQRVKVLPTVSTLSHIFLTVFHGRNSLFASVYFFTVVFMLPWSQNHQLPRRTMWRQRVILPGTHRSARHMRLNLNTYFNSSPICHLYVLLVEIPYQARFCLQISNPDISFAMPKGFLNRGCFIVHVLLLGTSKAFRLSVFLPGARVHINLPGTRRYL